MCIRFLLCRTPSLYFGADSISSCICGFRNWCLFALTLWHQLLSLWVIKLLGYLIWNCENWHSSWVVFWFVDLSKQLALLLFCVIHRCVKFVWVQGDIFIRSCFIFDSTIILWLDQVCTKRIHCFKHEGFFFSHTISFADAYYLWGCNLKIVKLVGFYVDIFKACWSHITFNWFEGLPCFCHLGFLQDCI